MTIHPNQFPDLEELIEAVEFPDDPWGDVLAECEEQLANAYQEVESDAAMAAHCLKAISPRRRRGTELSGKSDSQPRPPWDNLLYRPDLGAPRPRTRRRIRAEDCERLPLADLRPQPTPGDVRASLPDGTLLRLCWKRVRGCWAPGGQRGEGKALAGICPICERSIRVLWRPRGGAWGCRVCHRLSYPSERRSGSHRPGMKPLSTLVQQVIAAQKRTVMLLAAQRTSLVWSGFDPRQPQAPRLSFRREWDLRQRLHALELTRLGLIEVDLRRLQLKAGLTPTREVSDDQWLTAKQIVRSTTWAVRRPAQDPRSRRRQSGDLETGAGPSTDRPSQEAPAGLGEHSSVSTASSVHAGAGEPQVLNGRAAGLE